MQISATPSQPGGLQNLFKAPHLSENDEIEFEEIMFNIKLGTVVE